MDLQEWEDQLSWFSGILCAHVAQGKVTPRGAGEMFETELTWGRSEFGRTAAAQAEVVFAALLATAERKLRHG